MKKTIALYDATHSKGLALEYFGGEFDADVRQDFIRTSEPVEVDFPDIDRGVVTAQKIAIIDAQIKQVRADSQLQLNRLEQQKAELLALPSPAQ